MISDVVKIICIGDAAAKYFFNDSDEFFMVYVYADCCLKGQRFQECCRLGLEV